jgi:hypothetical protein
MPPQVRGEGEMRHAVQALWARMPKGVRS